MPQTTASFEDAAAALVTYPRRAAKPGWVERQWESSRRQAQRTVSAERWKTSVTQGLLGCVTPRSLEGQGAKQRLVGYARSLGVTIHLPPHPEVCLVVQSALERVQRAGLDVSGLEIRMGFWANDRLERTACGGEAFPSVNVAYLYYDRPESVGNMMRQGPSRCGTAEQAYVHELMHWVHYKTAREKFVSLLQAEFTPLGRSLALQVSPYASEAPLEFVAEAGTGLLYGARFDPAVLDAYRELGGPLPPTLNVSPARQ